MVDIAWRVESNGAYWTMMYKTPEGAWKGRSLGSKAKVGGIQAARREARRIAAEMARSPVVIDRRAVPTLERWRAAYFELRGDELDAGTVALHRTVFDRLIEFFGADARLDRITPTRADDWRRWLKQQPSKRGEGTLSPDTVASHVRTAKVIFNRAVKRQVLAVSPFANVKATAPRRDRDWHTVTRADLKRILDACPDDAWRALFALCRLAGLRRGEALRLEWRGVTFSEDPAERLLQVYPERRGGEYRRTTKQAYRVVPIEPDLYALLGRLRAAAGGEARVCPVKTDNIHRDALVILKRAGLPAYSKPFHTLRKNLESEWMAKHPVMAVCQWLGHSPTVAAEFYHRATAETVAQVTGAAEKDVACG